MEAMPIPAKFLEILEAVLEPGDRVTAVAPRGGVATRLAADVEEYPAEVWERDDLAPGRDALLLLDILPRLNAAGAARLAGTAASLLRPGGLLFVSARTVDHPAWTLPGPGWQPSGPRELQHETSGESRFFLYADEIITLFAAWNVLHHHEGSDGLVEAVLVKPEGRLADVATVLYGG